LLVFCWINLKRILLDKGKYKQQGIFLILERVHYILSGLLEDYSLNPSLNYLHVFYSSYLWISTDKHILKGDDSLHLKIFISCSIYVVKRLIYEPNLDSLDIERDIALDIERDVF
jgi:hypothetical protein